MQTLFGHHTVHRNVKKKYIESLEITKVNVSQNRMLCGKHWVIGLRAFLYYKNVVEAKRLIGDDIGRSQLEENPSRPILE